MKADTNIDSAIEPQFLSWVEQACLASISRASLIQTLWSGYGACFRAILELHDAKTTEGPLPVVVKCASPNDATQHPRGWSSITGHQRKLKSFAIENNFYNHIQPFTNELCKTPRSIAVETKENKTLLVMEDLGATGYSETTLSLCVTQAKVVLHWLAEFHATFIGRRASLNVKKPDGENVEVWREGTYWHLNTRHDEYNAMPSSELKTRAQEISTLLANSKYQTLLHGDAKVANFCFTPHYTQCAAVDFQYVGFGAGVKDVAYFLGSALSDNDQRLFRDRCLNVYFTALERALKRQCANSKTSITEEEIPLIVNEWRSLYSFACADFHRFLAGWSPNHTKINSELQYQTSLALNRLD